MKLRSLSVLTLISMTVLASSVVAQMPSQHDRVKGLEPFIGYWQSEVQQPNGPKGTLSGLGRWTSNKSFVQISWSFQPEGEEPMHYGTVLVGWNGKEKQLNSWAFFPDSVWVVEASLDGSVLSMSGSGTTAEGKATSSDTTYAIAGDELTVSNKNAKEDGEELPDSSYTLKKRERPRDVAVAGPGR